MRLLPLAPKRTGEGLDRSRRRGRGWGFRSRPVSVPLLEAPVQGPVAETQVRLPPQGPRSRRPARPPAEPPGESRLNVVLRLRLAPLAVVGAGARGGPGVGAVRRALERDPGRRRRGRGGEGADPVGRARPWRDGGRRRWRRSPGGRLRRTGARGRRQGRGRARALGRALSSRLAPRPRRRPRLARPTDA